MQDVIDLKDVLEARWFAGKARRVARVLQDGAFGVDEAGVLRCARVEYEDGGHERYLLPDAGLRWAPLLRALRAQPVVGAGGARLELRSSPALDTLWPAADATERVPALDQSNTLVALDERLLVKAYRRLESGVHPEVELGAALAGSDAPVPTHAGSLHLVAPDGAETAIALLQEFVPDAEAGWEAPIDAMAAALRTLSPSLGGLWGEAGMVVGRLHAALAERLGLARDPGAGERWRADAEAALAEAVRLDTVAAAHADALTARLAPLAPDLQRADGGPLVGRIHGDLHVAQLLRAPGRLLVVDLEGDPTLPLAQRRTVDTPLRDLAALLRSVDHVGAAAARRADGADPGALVEAARAAALSAYAERSSVPIDPALLSALEAAAACRELVYAHRVLPEWLYAARAGLERLLTR